MDSSALAVDVWASLVPSALRADKQARVRQLAIEAEARRQAADYDTGSILEVEAALLWALAEAIQARVVVEVGTFIGMSTTALASASTVQTVYTCDASNDCLPATKAIRTYPKCSSTDMLQDLRKRGVVADLCFFDGTLRPVDADLLKGLTHRETVFAFHDFNFGPKERVKHGRTYLQTVPRKGIGNVDLLKPRLWKHVLVNPLPDTTLALLVPEARL